MPRYFTVLSSLVALGFALSVNASATTSAQIETSPAGREYRVYPTSYATFAIVQGKYGLVLVKKTDLGVQHYALNAEGLTSVADADTRLMQKLIARYGIDEALARLEQVVVATAGTEKAELIQPAIATDEENDRGGAKVILAEVTPERRRRYPPRQPLPEEEDGPMDPGMGYPPPPDDMGGCVSPCGAPPPPCMGAPCGTVVIIAPPCQVCGPPPPPPPPALPPCWGSVCGGPVPTPYGGGLQAPIAVPLGAPIGRVPCDRRVYGNYCG